MAVGLVVIKRSKNTEFIFLETSVYHILLCVERSVHYPCIGLKTFLFLFFCNDIDYSTHGICAIKR